MAVCCMLLPHNPYRVPLHYKRHICWPTVAVNIVFYEYLWFFIISSFWTICIHYAIENLSGQQLVLVS